MHQVIILSKEPDSVFKTTAQRFHTVFFLGTPHRGSDSAQPLNNILRASFTHSSRPYITDLERSSHTIQILNDEFPRYYADIKLFSFFETIPTNLGYTTALVVDKQSATLGN